MEIAAAEAVQHHVAADVGSTEAVIWKIIRAAEVLKSAADHWRHCQRRTPSLRRHLRHCSATAALTLRAAAYSGTIGAAAKVAGGVTTVVGVVTRVPHVARAGRRLWMAGCVAKLAGLGGKVMADVWERGLKETLACYLSHLAGFLQSLSLLRAALAETGNLMPQEFSPPRFLPALMLACPEEVFPYAWHVVSLLVSPHHYSALHDFAALAASTFTAAPSPALAVLQELESLHVMEVMGSTSLHPTLQVASAVLHVGRELTDLAQGWRAATGREDVVTARSLLARLATLALSLTRKGAGGQSQAGGQRLEEIEG